MDKFQLGVKKAALKLSKVVHPCLHISLNAVKVLQVVLTHLNGQMIDVCQKKSRKGKGKRSSKRIMREQVAQAAVDAVLPGLLRKCATAEAHKCLAKYTAGAIVYKPRIMVVKKKKSKKTMGTSPEFLRAVPALAQMLDPFAGVDKDGRAMVADILQQMCRSVVEKSRALSTGPTLGPEDIIKAVEACMAPTMAKHAIAEGARNALVFTSGRSKYRPEHFVYRGKKAEEDEKVLKSILKDV